MRIKSPFKDFYDGCLAYGQDPTLLYVRKTTTIQFDTPSIHRVVNPYPLPAHITNKYTYDWLYKDKGGIPVGLNLEVIGFCGKLYPFAYVSNIGYPPLEGSPFMWSMEAVDAYLQQHMKPDAFEAFLKGRYGRDHHVWFFGGPTSIPYNSDRDWHKRDYSGLFEKWKVPIFVGNCREKKVILNPKLSSYQFFKVFDSYRAWQALEMYMSNVARPLKPIPEISDEDMLLAKGFDKKFSFRKEKSKRV